MIQSVNRAIDLLQAVAGRSHGAGVTELARACDLKVQTAQTLLKTLAFRHLLVFDKRHRCYRLGSALVSLADQVDRVDMLTDFVAPQLEAMYHETGETVSALALQGGEFLLLRAHGADTAFTRLPSGQIMRHPADMASGRVLAGRLPKPELDALISEHVRLRRGPESGLTTKGLAAIIAQALACGETSVINQEAGLQALAVAVPLGATSVHLALACNIPLARHTAALERQLLRLLRDHAARLGVEWQARTGAGPGLAAPPTRGAGA